MARLHRFLSRCALVACAFGLPAAAQTPPVKLVVGAPPGGTTDTVARNIGQHMSQTLRRTVMIENRPGAGGIAADYVAKSAPDGNTLLVTFTSFSINASLYRKLPFDPVRDFTPISMLARVPSLLVTRRTSPPRTWPPSSNRSGRILASTRWRSARWARRCTWPASA